MKKDTITHFTNLITTKLNKTPNTSLKHSNNNTTTTATLKEKLITNYSTPKEQTNHTSEQPNNKRKRKQNININTHIIQHTHNNTINIIINKIFKKQHKKKDFILTNKLKRNALFTMRKQQQPENMKRGCIIRNNCLNCKTIFISTTAHKYLKDFEANLVPDIKKHTTHLNHNIGPNTIIKERSNQKSLQNYTHILKADIKNRLTPEEKPTTKIIICGNTTMINADCTKTLEDIMNTSSDTRKHTKEKSQQLQ